MKLLLLASLALATAATASPNGGPLGDFEAHTDVGSPKIAGYAAYNGATQLYTLSAGGVNIWAKRDEFHFAYRRMKGDFIVQAMVEFQGKGVDPHRKAGIMARASIADFDSPYVDGALHGDGLTSLQFRKGKGEDTAQTEMPAAKGANVIQLERRGNLFILSAARFGEPFEVAEIKDASFVPEEAYVGLYLSSHNPDVKETAFFRNVRVIKPVKVGFQPYRDYIGSRLELLNVSNGHRGQVYSSRVPFEAPNWLPDGSALIYNASGNDPATRGRLWKFDLMTRTPTLIDTEFAIRNNNDHSSVSDGTQPRHQRPEHGRRPVDHLHAADARWRAQTHHTAVPQLHARLDAGREVADLHRRPDTQRGKGKRVRHLQGGFRRQWQGDQSHQLPGPRRRSGSEPRRPVDLFQLRAFGTDADLAHARRLREEREELRRRGTRHQR
jgi:hypothetical protein